MEFRRDRDSGLLVPAERAQEAEEERLREQARAEVARRRWQPKDKLVRQDGRKRKGAHTQGAYRRRANRKNGLKGVLGAR